MDSGLAELYSAQKAVRNVVCSVSGLEAARALEKMGVPMDAGFFLDDEEEKAGKKVSGKRVLLVHQQIMACSIREWMRKKWPDLQIDCALFFQMDKAFMEENDVKMDSENDWIDLIKKRNYDVIAGDPIFKRAISFWNGDYVPAPQYAVSGGMYAPDSDEAYWENLKKGLAEAVEK